MNQKLNNDADIGAFSNNGDKHMAQKLTGLHSTRRRCSHMDMTEGQLRVEGAEETYRNPNISR